MFFFRQFESFDPLTGYVPESPFTYLPEIAQRARALLGSRSMDQVIAAAKRISREIESYFNDARDAEIYRLEEEINPKDENFALYFEWNGGTRDNGRWIFKDSMADELGIPTVLNTSVVDALKAVIESRDDYGFFLNVEPEPLEYPEGKDYELFAVVALWLLADAMKSAQGRGTYSLSIAGEYAVKAMDAVCYAEHLRDVDWLVSNIKDKSRTELLEALHKQKIEQAEWVRHCLKVRKEREKQKKSEQAKQLNKARHQNTYQAKDMVTKEWESNRNKFNSAEKAGHYYADWLEKNNIVNLLKGKPVPYQPRTVIGWIRAHAKLIGIKLR